MIVMIMIKITMMIIISDNDNFDNNNSDNNDYNNQNCNNTNNCCQTPQAGTTATHAYWVHSCSCGSRFDLHDTFPSVHEGFSHLIVVKVFQVWVCLSRPYLLHRGKYLEYTLQTPRISHFSDILFFMTVFLGVKISSNPSYISHKIYSVIKTCVANNNHVPCIS